jgi:hypothetical protein
MTESVKDDELFADDSPLTIEKSNGGGLACFFLVTLTRAISPVLGSYGSWKDTDGTCRFLRDCA